MIVAGDALIERKSGRSSSLAKVIHPLIARNRCYPWSERAGWQIRVPIGVDGEKRFLSDIFSGRRRKPARIIAPQPAIQFAEQLLILPPFAALRRDHKATPIYRPLSPIDDPRRSPGKTTSRGLR